MVSSDASCYPSFATCFLYASSIAVYSKFEFPITRCFKLALGYMCSIVENCLSSSTASASKENTCAAAFDRVRGTVSHSRLIRRVQARGISVQQKMFNTVQ